MLHVKFAFNAMLKYGMLTLANMIIGSLCVQLPALNGAGTLAAKMAVNSSLLFMNALAQEKLVFV